MISQRVPKSVFLQGETIYFLFSWCCVPMGQRRRSIAVLFLSLLKQKQEQTISFQGLQRELLSIFYSMVELILSLMDWMNSLIPATDRKSAAILSRSAISIHQCRFSL